MDIRIQYLCIDSTDPGNVATFWPTRSAGAARSTSLTRSAWSRRLAVPRTALRQTFSSFACPRATRQSQ
jgi:hypothetical protein